MYAELKQTENGDKMENAAWRICAALIVIEKQSKWRRFAHKLLRQSFLDVFLAEKY